MHARIDYLGMQAAPRNVTWRRYHSDYRNMVLVTTGRTWHQHWARANRAYHTANIADVNAQSVHKSLT